MIVKMNVWKILFFSISLITIILIVEDIKVARKNNSHINQEIYIAFRKIESDCLQKKYLGRSKRCQLVLDMEDRCSDPRHFCPAEEYYETLSRIGFDLPPFYEPNYKKKHPLWKFWK